MKHLLSQSSVELDFWPFTKSSGMSGNNVATLEKGSDMG